MRKRGQVFWNWVDPNIYCRNYDDCSIAGFFINIQVRTSMARQTQLFLGIYGAKGTMLLEESYWDCQGMSMTKAVDWALQHAYELLNSNQQ